MSEGHGWIAAQLERLREAIYETSIPRRERIATAVMQGMSSNVGVVEAEWAADISIEWADALIAQLDKEKQG